MLASASCQTMSMAKTWQEMMTRPSAWSACSSGARGALRRAQATAAALAAADGSAGGQCLAGLLEVTVQIAPQARQRLAGTMPDGATRRVSVHEPDARAIARPARHARRVRVQPQLTGDDDGIITDYAVVQGNPADGPQLAPAVQRVIKRADKTPRTVTADRSYGEKAIEDDVYGLGVRHVMIPRKGKPGKVRQAAERRPAFRRTVKWRTGSEGRISTLKRQYGQDRTRLDGTGGARIWAGHGSSPTTWSRSGTATRAVWSLRPEQRWPPRYLGVQLQTFGCGSPEAYWFHSRGVGGPASAQSLA